MRNLIAIVALSGIALLIAACGDSAPANNANTITNGNSRNANQPLTTTKKPEAETVNNAPTIGPVVQAFYDALRKKDSAALKETITAEFATSLEADMRAEGGKDLAAFVAELDYREGQVMEVRNEKVDGDRAVAEIRGGPYKNWTPFDFKKENGKWRFTGTSPDVKSVSQ